jgi:hypothetical protein
MPVAANRRDSKNGLDYKKISKKSENSTAKSNNNINNNKYVLYFRQCPEYKLPFVT